MEVFIIDILHAGFVVLLHSAGAVQCSYTNVHASIGYLTGNVFSPIRSESKLSVLYYESLPDKI